MGFKVMFGGIVINKFLLIWAIAAIVVLCTACTHKKSVSYEKADSVSYEAPQTEQKNEYSVNLEVNPDKGFFKGIEKIKYTNNSNNSTDTIYFYVPDDYIDFNIMSITVNNEQLAYKKENNILTVDLHDSLNSNAVLDMVLQFECYLPEEKSADLFFSGNFLPTAAVNTSEVFNINNLNSEISNFDITITIPEAYNIAGGGNGTLDEFNGNKSVRFKETMIRNFAFSVSSDYSKYTLTDSNGVEINLFCSKEFKNYDEVLNTAELYLSLFGNAAGSYPYKTLNIAETDLSADEKFSYSEIIFIDTDDLNSDNYRKALSEGIAHQWFGNIISSNKNNEFIIDGICSFMQLYVFFDNETIAANILNEYNTIMGNPDSFQNLNESEKCKFFIYSIYKNTDSENFDLFVKEFYKRFAFKNISKKDFISVYDEFGLNPEKVFSDWFND